MLRLVARPRAERTLGALPEGEYQAALAALRAIPSAFGRPHLHSGLGIRQLRSGVYEARIGLDLRAAFVREGDELKIQVIGTHDEVKRFLRGI